MEDRDPIRFPNRDDHDLRVYSAIVGRRRPVNGNDKRHAARKHFGFREWAGVQRLLHDTSLPPQVRAKLAPLLERAHQRWCEAFGRFSVRRERSSKPDSPRDHGRSAAPTNDSPRL